MPDSIEKTATKFRVRPLAEGLSTDPYPHVVLENYADPALVAQAREELAVFEAKIRQPQMADGGFCYRTDTDEIMRGMEATAALEAHFGSAAFFDEMIETLAPFAEGRLAISLEEIRSLASDAKKRTHTIKFSGTGDEYVVRVAHVDAPCVIMTYLFYVRLPNDFSTGGHLRVQQRNPRPASLKGRLRQRLLGQQLSLIKSVECRTNTFFAFLNGADSFHEVSPRRNSRVSRVAFQGGLAGARDLFS